MCGPREAENGVANTDGLKNDSGSVNRAETQENNFGCQQPMEDLDNRVARALPSVADQQTHQFNTPDYANGTLNSRVTSNESGDVLRRRLLSRRSTKQVVIPSNKKQMEQTNTERILRKGRTFYNTNKKTAQRASTTSQTSNKIADKSSALFNDKINVRNTIASVKNAPQQHNNPIKQETCDEAATPSRINYTPSFQTADVSQQNHQGAAVAATTTAAIAFDKRPKTSSRNSSELPVISRNTPPKHLFEAASNANRNRNKRVILPTLINRPNQ